MPEPSGILLVHKTCGMTSHDVVGKVRRLFGTRRVGHTGTLDPMASGLLVVLVGRAAKAAEYLSCDRKAYLATLRLGLTTDTEDTTGTVLTTCDTLPNAETVITAAARFEGEISQIPPMYSALKVDGRKLCDLARRGVTVERKPRPITIYRLLVTPTESPSDYTMALDCSSGTYVRTLCADIGQALGCGGAMASLVRTRAGGFSLDDAATLSELEALDEEARASRLLPIETLFADMEACALPAFYERLCRNGCEIYQKKIGTNYALGTRLRLLSADGHFFAIGEVREYEAGTAIKSLKFFDLE